MEKKINIIFWLQIVVLLCVITTIVLSVLCLHPCFNKEHQENYAFGFDGDRIQTSATKVWPADAANRIVNSYNTLTINGTRIHLEVERIDTVAIKAVTGNGTKEMEELLADCTPTSACTNTLGAIEIFYAVVNGSFKLYYKPVIFCPQSEPRYGQGGHYYRGYYRLSTGDRIYKYDRSSKSFVTEDQTVVNSAIAAYTASIGIERPEEHSPTENSGFYSDTTHPVYGDVTSVIIPIEEFVVLAKSTTQIRLWNAIEPLSLTEKDSGEKDINLVKHIIILSTDDVDEDYNNHKLYYYTYSKFSDMSHLCPPSCNLDQYTFATKEVYKVPTLAKSK